MSKILWFRRDLRIEDQPLLSTEGSVFPIFIFDTTILRGLKADDKRVTFIFDALTKLKENLKKQNLDIAIFLGNPDEVFNWILSQGSYSSVIASGDYDSYSKERDRAISMKLPFNWINDTYIFKPNEILKKDGTPYLVFTPFYKHCKTIFNSTHIKKFTPAKSSLLQSFDYDSIHIIDQKNCTKKPFVLHTIGFVKNDPLYPDNLSPENKLLRFKPLLKNYSLMRDFMAEDGTSHLALDLRFGTISIREILRWLAKQKKNSCDTEPFFRQLIFREFYASLLYHFPRLEKENFRYNFKGKPNKEYFERFCNGETGVPIIDAGIKELISTGHMHNRVRMICASFFTKNLLLPWQWGEEFFRSHLLDYDAASNILSWQWSAGTGVDPQPYFRVFNPYTQGNKFDHNGDYIKRWLPELSSIPEKYLHDEEKIKEYRPNDYPTAIVEHSKTAKASIEAFKNSMRLFEN